MLYVQTNMEAISKLNCLIRSGFAKGEGQVYGVRGLEKDTTACESRHDRFIGPS